MGVLTKSMKVNDLELCREFEDEAYGIEVMAEFGGYILNKRVSTMGDSIDFVKDGRNEFTLKVTWGLMDIVRSYKNTGWLRWDDALEEVKKLI
jgi:hypothetical protein